MALCLSHVSFVIYMRGSVAALHDTQTEQGSNTDLVSRRQFRVLDQECRLNSQEEIGQGLSLIHI